MSTTEKIKSLLKDEIDVIFTDNRTSMISVRRKAGGSHSVRLHSMFLDAGEDVIKAISDYIKGKRRGSIEIIRRFINNNLNKIKALPDKRDNCPAKLLYTIGRHFNLKEIFDRLNTDYFNGTISVKITWGRNICNGRRYIRFGSYTERGDIIRIHPTLDQDFVPLYFIESIVYHEMLHKFVGVRIVNGVRRIHTPEFKKMERDFEDYEKARGWEKSNIKRLIRHYG
jgi:hypothetical protein